MKFQTSLILGLFAGTVCAHSAGAEVVGYWRFEDTHFLADSGAHGNTLTALAGNPATADGGPDQVALPSTGSGSMFGYPGNTSAAQFVGADSDRFSLADNASLNSIITAFTIEAYVNLGSTVSSPSTAVRTIATQGGNSTISGGWALIVTNETSSRGARNLLFQFQPNANAWGTSLATIDTNIQLTVGVDYYIAVAFNVLDTTADGLVVYVKDLTNNGDLQVLKFTHAITTLANSTADFVIGNSSAGTNAQWDGLVDEVRLSNAQLDASELLIAIPEPYSLGLLIISGVSLFRRR